MIFILYKVVIIVIISCNKLFFIDTENPYNYMVNKKSIGLYKIKVVVYDLKGNSITGQMKILFFNIKT
ncbi:hypothetical protein AYK25_06085 [Thermoplasmatales archaeon SM1-50]|nr:MAG: hypothetical protein AYK25_06085 [Thermoplasmatales archaeon SM1-50]